MLIRVRLAPPRLCICNRSARELASRRASRPRPCWIVRLFKMQDGPASKSTRRQTSRKCTRSACRLERLLRHAPSSAVKPWRRSSNLHARQANQCHCCAAGFCEEARTRAHVQDRLFTATDATSMRRASSWSQNISPRPRRPNSDFNSHGQQQHLRRTSTWSCPTLASAQCQQSRRPTDRVLR